MPPANQSVYPPYISPNGLAPNLLQLLQQARMRQRQYEDQIRHRAHGLALIQQQAMQDLQTLAMRAQAGDTRAAQMQGALTAVVRAVVGASNTSPELEGLVRRERFIQDEVTRILQGLPPTLMAQGNAQGNVQGTVAAPTSGGSAKTPQGQPQLPAQLAGNPATQGEALLQAMAAAQPMPIVGVQGGVPGMPVPAPGQTNVMQFPTGQAAPQGPAQAQGPGVIHMPVVQTPNTAPNAPTNGAAPATQVQVTPAQGPSATQTPSS